jgi:hypothetical protein
MEIFTNTVIAFSSAILAWATINLARHTKALSDLTRSLVNIEEKRDQRELRQRRLDDLRRALDAAETIQKITPRYFATYLSRSDTYPESDIQAIETLQSLKRYIDDADANLCLDDLCNDFDEVRREKTNYKPKTETTTKNIQTIQIKVLRFIKEWRVELGSAG